MGQSEQREGQQGIHESTATVGTKEAREEAELRGTLRVAQREGSVEAGDQHFATTDVGINLGHDHSRF